MNGSVTPGLRAAPQKGLKGEQGSPGRTKVNRLAHDEVGGGCVLKTNLVGVHQGEKGGHGSSRRSTRDDGLHVKQKRKGVPVHGETGAGPRGQFHGGI